jgi:hypothetical protein
MFALQKSNRKASARNQIDIKGVKSNMLILPHNRYRAILSVSPVNFKLKSEAERDAIIDTYESFLNSLGFPLQILIRTREINLDSYLADLRANRELEKKAVYRSQLENYEEFIRGLIETNKILSRSFYVIVPYLAERKLDFEGIEEQVAQRVEITSDGLARLGISSRRLSDLEILDLFYTFYSPRQAKLQPLSVQALELLHTEYIQKGALDE